MRNTLFAVVRMVALVVVTYYAGLYLAQYIVHRYMQEMPLWMYDVIRFTLDHTSNSGIREPDDLSAIALLAVLTASWITAALIIIPLYFSLRRRIGRRCRHLNDGQ